MRDRRHALAGNATLGVVAGLLGALGQAAGALLAKPALTRVASLEATFIRVVAGALGMLLIGVVARRLGVWVGLIRHRHLYVSMSVASFFGPFLGIFLMTVALDRAQTGVALTLLATTPLWLLPLGAWVQRDPPTAREIAGVVIALTGVGVLLLK